MAIIPDLVHNFSFSQSKKGFQLARLSSLPLKVRLQKFNTQLRNEC